MKDLIIVGQRLHNNTVYPLLKRFEMTSAGKDALAEKLADFRVSEVARRGVLWFLRGEDLSEKALLGGQLSRAGEESLPGFVDLFALLQISACLRFFLASRHCVAIRAVSAVVSFVFGLEKPVAVMRRSFSPGTLNT